MKSKVICLQEIKVNCALTDMSCSLWKNMEIGCKELSANGTSGEILLYVTIVFFTEWWF